MLTIEKWNNLQRFFRVGRVLNYINNKNANNNMIMMTLQLSTKVLRRTVYFNSALNFYPPSRPPNNFGF